MQYAVIFKHRSKKQFCSTSFIFGFIAIFHTNDVSGPGQPRLGPFGPTRCMNTQEICPILTEPELDCWDCTMCCARWVAWLGFLSPATTRAQSQYLAHRLAAQPTVRPAISAFILHFTRTIYTATSHTKSRYSWWVARLSRTTVSALQQYSPTRFSPGLKRVKRSPVRNTSLSHICTTFSTQTCPVGSFLHVHSLPYELDPDGVIVSVAAFVLAALMIVASLLPHFPASAHLFERRVEKPLERVQKSTRLPWSLASLNFAVVSPTRLPLIDFRCLRNCKEERDLILLMLWRADILERLCWSSPSTQKKTGGNIIHVRGRSW